MPTVKSSYLGAYKLGGKMIHANEVGSEFIWTDHSVTPYARDDDGHALHYATFTGTDVWLSHDAFSARVAHEQCLADAKWAANLKEIEMGVPMKTRIKRHQIYAYSGTLANASASFLNLWILYHHKLNALSWLNGVCVLFSGWTAVHIAANAQYRYGSFFPLQRALRKLFRRKR